MYFPQNWEFGLTLSILGILGGGFEPPQTPLPSVYYGPDLHKGLKETHKYFHVLGCGLMGTTQKPMIFL
jgi:hypothetical protein